MTAWKAVLDIIEVLKLNPAGMLSANYIGLRIPQSGDDLPAIVVSIKEVEETPIGIGGIVEAHRVSGVQWDTTTGKRTSGLLSFDIWAADEQSVTNTVEALFQTLAVSVEEMRKRNFIKFNIREIKVMENVTIDGQNALRMAIVCSTVYEEINADTVGPGGIIKEIHVDIDDELQENIFIQKE